MPINFQNAQRVLLSAVASLFFAGIMISAAVPVLPGRLTGMARGFTMKTTILIAILSFATASLAILTCGQSGIVG